jgi:hypothetical protein
MRNEFDWYNYTVKPVVVAILAIVFMMVVLGGFSKAEENKCMSEVEKFDKVISDSLKAGYDLNVLDYWSYKGFRGFLVQPKEDQDKNVPMWFFFVVDKGCADPEFPAWHNEADGRKLIERLEGQGV